MPMALQNVLSGLQTKRLFRCIWVIIWPYHDGSSNSRPSLGYGFYDCWVAVPSLGLYVVHVRNLFWQNCFLATRAQLSTLSACSTRIQTYKVLTCIDVRHFIDCVQYILTFSVTRLFRPFSNIRIIHFRIPKIIKMTPRTASTESNALCFQILEN